MRIISKFHDYYDGVQKYGYDKNDTIYVREQKKYSIKDSPFGLPKGLMSHGAPEPSRSGIEVTYYTIGFCGRIYVTYAFNGNFYYSIPSLFRAGEEASHNSFLRLTDYIKQARALDKKKRKNKSHYNLLGEGFFRFTEKEWERWKEQAKDKVVMPIDSYIEYQTPIFMFDSLRRTLVVNPCLRKFQFHKVVDSYTAYQEIDMFIGNQLAKQMDSSTTRTDDDIRDSKGMDKWSFRKKV